MAAPAVGFAAKFAIGTADPVDQPLEFLSESLRKTGTVLDTGGIRGTRSHDAARTRNGTYTVAGTVTLNPSPLELDDLLPWILGTNEAADVFALADLLQSRFIQFDRVTKVFKYAGVYVNRATFRASEGGFVELSLDLIGQTETVAAAGSFPSLTLNTDPPYVFHDLAFTIGGTTYQSKEIEIVVDNRVVSRFLNSQTATGVFAIDREVSVRFTLPYSTDEVALYDTGATGAIVNATFTNGGVSCLFSMVNVQFPAEAPIVESKDEIVLALNGIARKSGATLELVVTSDSTA